MDFPTPIPVTRIAEMVGGKLEGDASIMATGINEIHKVRPGDIMFVDLDKYYKKALNSAATVIIIDKNVDVPEGKAIIQCEDPFIAYNSLVNKYRSPRYLSRNIGENCQIDPSVIIEPNVVIGNDVTIGTNTVIKANSYIGDYTVIGSNVEIQANVVIGSDAFYFKRRKTHLEKFTSGGRVIIHDNVLISASCTVSRGVSGDTIIGEGTKLDCLVHIGHGVVIGKNCQIAGQAGVGGKTIIGDNVILLGQAGLTHNLKVGDNAVILAKSGSNKDIPEGSVIFGMMGKDARVAFKEMIALKNLAKRKPT